LLELWAGINLLAVTEYERLELDELKLIKMIIQLADSSTKLPALEDVLIGVGEIYLSVDLILLKIDKVANVANQISVIIGHPSLDSYKALINCRNGMMRLTFDKITSEVNIFNLQRHP